MAQEFDAVVVGAGLGGLAAAARLASHGLQVLVADGNPHPGGSSYSFQRRGFRFPMGPMGFSSPELVRGLWRELTAEDVLELRPVRYRVCAYGLDVPVSPLDDLSRALAAAAPADAEGVERFFTTVREIIEAIKQSSGEGDGVLEMATSTPAAEYLAEAVKDQRLVRILGSIGTSRPYSTLALLAAMWNLCGNEGVWTPQAGMRFLADRLVRAVESAGTGRIMLRNEVVEIKVDHDRVTGVALEEGEAVHAPLVIANSDFRATFLRLVEAEILPPEWVAAVFNARLTRSNLQVGLGLDASVADLSAFREAERIIYRRTRDAEEFDAAGPDWQALEIDPDALAGQELELSLWSASDAGAAPPGHATLVIRTEAEYAHFARYRPERGRRLRPYQDYKMRLARALMREASRVAPGLTESVVVMDVATPLTFEELSGRSGGAVAGWSWDFEDSRDARPRELIRTPVRGLYMAGYQAFSSLGMGGVPTALMSGKLAAEAALRGDGPVTEVNIPGADT